MFPGPGAQVYYNEAGEPLGWDNPGEPEYCADCGGMHDTFACPYDRYDGEDQDIEEGEDDGCEESDRETE